MQSFGNIGLDVYGEFSGVIEMLCKEIEVDRDNFSTGVEIIKKGDVFVTAVKTPSPTEICAKAFGMLLPIVTAMH